MPTIIFDVVLCPDVHLISVNLPDCGFVNREGAETGPQYTIFTVGTTGITSKPAKDKHF